MVELPSTKLTHNKGGLRYTLYANVNLCISEHTMSWLISHDALGVIVIGVACIYG